MNIISTTLNLNKCNEQPPGEKVWRFNYIVYGLHNQSASAATIAFHAWWWFLPLRAATHLEAGKHFVIPAAALQSTAVIIGC